MFPGELDMIGAGAQERRKVDRGRQVQPLRADNLGEYGTRKCHRVLTRARPNGTLESVAGNSIIHWRQCRGRRFVVCLCRRSVGGGVGEALAVVLLGGVARAGLGAAAKI